MIGEELNRFLRVLLRDDLKELGHSVRIVTCLVEDVSPHFVSL